MTVLGLKRALMLRRATVRRARKPGMQRQEAHFLEQGCAPIALTLG